MNHQSAVEKALDGHRENVVEYMANIGARLDSLIAQRVEHLVRVAIQAKHDSAPMSVIVANLRAADITEAKIDATTEALHDALRSHGALKAYAEALKDGNGPQR